MQSEGRMSKRTPYVYDITTQTAVRGPAYNFSEINILVVDGCQPFRRMIAKILHRFGFQAVYEATNGDEAIEQIRHHNIDIVMTEWDMKPMDGHALIQRLRSDSKLADDELRLIMLAGQSIKARVVAARDAGVDGFLRKPVSPEDLFKRIVSVIEHPVGIANLQSAGQAEPDAAGPAAGSPTSE